MDIGKSGPQQAFVGHSRAAAGSVAPSVLGDTWLVERFMAMALGPVLLVDRTRKIRAFNAATLSCFCLEPARIAQKTLAALVGTSLYRRRLQPAIDAALMGEVRSIEISLTNRVRPPAEFHFRCAPFLERDGQVSGVWVQARDVTDICQLRERFRNLIEASLQGVYVYRDWTPLFANDTCAQIFGFGSALELFSQVESMDELIVPAELERLKSYSKALMQREPVPAEYEFEAIRKDGTVITVRNHARVVQWGGAPAILGSCVDISESRRSGALLEAQRRILELVATGTDLEVTLGQLCLEVERLVPESMCSIMLLTEGFLRLAAGPSLSDELAADLAVVEPSFGRGSCATATMTGELEAVSDTLVDSRWAALRTAARRHGVRACWSIPIVSSREELLGTFAVSHRRPLVAKKADVKVMVSASQLAAIALERHRAEDALTHSEERFRDFADIAADWFWETNSDLALSYVAGRYVDVLGVEAGELLGRSRRELFGVYVEPDPIFEQRLRALTTHKAFDRIEQRWVTPSGAKKVLQISGRPMFDHDGTFRGYRGVGSDVTVAHTLSERLSHEVSHDALTGLVNRREFEQRMGRVLDSARENGSAHALCYMDLDQFKVVNDTCGHVAGDELLRQLGEILQKQVRKRDTLARLGGDEFGVLMEHCSIEEATRVANAQRRAIEEFRFLWEDKAFALGVSIGLVPIDSESGSTINVLRAADTACYAAKDLGRNRIHLYTPDDANAARHRGEIRWVSRINQALENAELYLVYQPIRRLDEGGDFGLHYELLLRMREKDGREITPGSFLPAAERYNLSPRIDRWVVSNAFEWLAARPQHLSRLDTCSVNLSGYSLGEEDLLAFISDAFESGRVPPEKICLEITETTAIANLSAAAHFIRTLKRLGCKFALDDFGSGLSSFAYLKNLPVDYLKIDGCFVRDIVTDEVDLAMVRSINELGHVLGKKTIAEFVENEAILAKLRELNVDYAQGYHVGPPRPLSGLS